MTTFDGHEDLALGHVLVPPSPSLAGESLTASNIKWPAVPFNVTVCPANEEATQENGEIIRVEENSGGHFGKVKRAQEGTTARSIITGDKIFNSWSKKTATDVENAILSVEPKLTPAGGLSGQVLTKITSADYSVGWASPGSAAVGSATIVAFPGGTVNAIGAAGPVFGVGVSKEHISEAAYAARVGEFFESWTPETELKMEETYAGTIPPSGANITKFLELSNVLGRKKKARGHALIWHQGLAAWANKTFLNTPAKTREEVKKYITNVVTAVGSRVDCWDVLNEVISDTGELRTSLWTEIFGSTAISTSSETCKFFAECFRWAHEANPQALLFMNEYEVETMFNYQTVGGPSAQKEKGTMYLKLAKVLQELGAPIGGVGFEIHRTTEHHPLESELLEIFPKWTEKSLTVEATEVTIQFEGSGASDEVQKEAYAGIFKAFTAAGMGRVTVWSPTDKFSYLGASTLFSGPRPCLFDVNYGIKPAGEVLTEVRTMLTNLASFRELTLNYTLVYADLLKTIYANKTGGKLEVTVPSYETVPFPVGTTIPWVQWGTGQLTFVPAGSAVVLHSAGINPTGSAAARAQFSQGAIQNFKKNEWLVPGDVL